MKKRESITKIMTEQLHTISVTESLTDAEVLMKKKNIRHLPVMEGDKLAGILSLTDLMRISFVDSYKEEDESVDTAVYNMLTLKQVMISKPVTIQAKQTIREAAEILSENEFHCLPVMEGDQLTGIVTTTDLIKYLLNQY